MYNWSVDEKAFKKADPEGYKIWCSEQMINYGLDGGRLDRRFVRKHWKKIFMDTITRKYLRFLLWPPKPRS